MRRHRLWFACVAMLAGTACSSSGTPDGGLEVRSASTVHDAEATFVLVVTNQSFERPSIHVEVDIDGERVVSELFAVEGQHRFVSFAFDLAPGEHTLTATAAGRHTVSGSFAVVEGERHHGTLTFWADDTTDPRLDLQFSEEPPAFG